MRPAEAIRKADRARARGSEHAARYWVQVYRESKERSARLRGRSGKGGEHAHG